MALKLCNIRRANPNSRPVSTVYGKIKRARPITAARFVTTSEAVPFSRLPIPPGL